MELIKYFCGVCGTSRQLPPGPLPEGWRIPRAPTADHNLSHLVLERAVVACCSERCEAEHEEQQKPRRGR